MKLETLEISSPRPAARALAVLGNSHGYRFDADTVWLNAMFTVLDPAAHEQQWALQLWACPVAPVPGGPLHGHLVAHAALPPIGEIADDTESFEVGVFAQPPAGDGEWVMVLALVSGRDRHFDDVAHFVTYPRTERFFQPSILGGARYRIEGDQVRLKVEAIRNPRALENLSGTLSLELWALSEPYRGGAFSGAELAGVQVGRLAGQEEMTGIDVSLPFHTPPTGVWHFVLMLREWTAAGFVTRDFIGFSRPVGWSAPAVVAEAPETSAELPAASVTESTPMAEIATNDGTLNQPARMTLGARLRRFFGRLFRSEA